MKKIKVSEATNNQLNWLTASLLYCDEYDRKRVFLYSFGHEGSKYHTRIANQETCEAHTSFEWRPTTDPAQMWPIIHRENISVYSPLGEPVSSWLASRGRVHMWGQDGLIAAARCYIVSKLGGEVEVPKELT